MYGSKACQLVKEIASSEKGQLTPFSKDVFDEAIAECDYHHDELKSLLRKMQEEGVDIQTTRNADQQGVFVRHLSLLRNKRCLMAYMYNRAEILRNLVWKVGSEIPGEILEKLSHSEKEYLENHSASLKSYMSRVLLELAVDMVPPKDPYIKVRVLDDIGEVTLLSDHTANFARHSIHFLKRTDAEKYISRGMMEELTG